MALIPDPELCYQMKQIRIILLVLLSVKGFAQDDEHLTISEAESKFLQHNYQLLAQRYQVNAQEALVQQAKLWDNPSLSSTLGFGTFQKFQPFNIGSGGQIDASIDQLILLAGKRNKQVQLARMNAATSAAAFDELMRTLRLQLRSNYYQLYFLQATEKVLQEQLSNLSRIVDAYRAADAKGSVAHADVIRLQALQVGLMNDYADLRQQELEARLNLQLLLGDNKPVSPAAGSDVLRRYNLNGYTLQSLTDSALANRPDLRLADNQYRMAGMNLKLQKAMAVPDLHLGATYDRNGSYAPNFVGLTVGIDIPAWNRNQGNIKAAGFDLRTQDANLQQQRFTVAAEVQAAWERINFLDKNVGETKLDEFNIEYNKLIAEVARNFRNGNISLLQFIDYFDSYSDHIKHTNKFLTDRVLAYEELNYATGTQLFNTTQQ